MTAGGARFDVRAYVRTPIDVRPTDIDVTAAVGISSRSAQSLAYLCRVEGDTLDLMRDLLVTPTHAESRVTAFLTTWAYEQFWMAQSLRALVQAAGADADLAGTAAARALRHWDERVVPTVGAVRTNLLGHDLVAGHMVIGWLNTQVSALAFKRLATIEATLADAAAALAPMRQRHAEFYRDEAFHRLHGSPGSQRLARRAVTAWRWPGVRYYGRRTAAPVVRHLLADPVAQAPVRAIDEAVSQLPGLAGMAPVRAALGSLARC